MGIFSTPFARPAAGAALLLALVACDGEPLDLTPPIRNDLGAAGGQGGSGNAGGQGGSGNSGGQGGSGNSGGQGGSGNAGGSGNSGGGGAGGGNPAPCPSDEVVANYAAQYLGAINASCSAGPACHTGVPNDRDGLFRILEGTAATLTPAQVRANFLEFDEHVVWGDPEASAMITAGRGDDGHFRSWRTTDAVYQRVSDFIRDTDPCPPAPVLPDQGVGGAGGDGGMGGAGGDAGGGGDAGEGGEGGLGGSGGGAGVPCEALPGRDPLNRRGYYEAFRDRINGLLLDPAPAGGGCADGACHGTPGFGGSLWLATEGDCVVEWNFMIAQSFILPENPVASPLSEQPVAPRHGGREVFNGRVDPRYIELYQWIVSGTP